MPPADQDQLPERLARETAKLSSGTDTSPFSGPGFSRLQEKVEAFITELVKESVTVAHRHRSDVASPEHVDMAEHHLVAYQSRRWYKACGTIGGVLCGAAASSLLAMMLVSQFPTLVLALTVAFAMVGGILTTAHIIRG